MGGGLLAALRGTVGGTVAEPGDDGYKTSPLNTTADQRPRAVVRATSADDVAAAVRAAAEHGLGVVVQATGHGAAGTVGDDAVIVESGGLSDIEVDPERRLARVGAGVTWDALTAAAAPHGLVGLAGTAPTVGVAGYTFQGGCGWTVRAHGLASARLHAVDYVDAAGRQRRADADSDPDALWAFRGGFGVGVATAIEFELLPQDEFWAGFLLFELDDLPAVAEVWSQATDGMNPAVSTILGVMKAAPPSPAVAETAQGRPATYLGLCSTEVASGERLSDELRAALPRPTTDTIGRTALADLSAIHLDPPVAVPAFGQGEFLTGLPDTGAEVLAAGGIGQDGPLDDIEIRHVAPGPVPQVDGADTTVAGPFLLHATGEAPDELARARVQERLSAVRDVIREVDTGRRPAGFCDGHTSAQEALAPEARRRLASLLRERDPAGLLRPARPMAVREPAAP